MKFLNDISVRAKLLMITIPLAAALVFSVVFMAVQINTTEQEVSGVYYDTLYSVNNALVNSDRDFYQAVLAATHCFDLLWDAKHGYGTIDPTELGEYQDDYTSNAEQVIEGIRKAAEIAKQNDDLYNKVKSEDGLSFAQAYEAFEADYEEWYSIFQLTADEYAWDCFNEAYPIAREDINAMQEITETWAAQEHSVIKRQIAGKVVTIAIFFALIIAVLAVLVIAVMRGIRIGLKKATDNLCLLATGDLGVSFPDESEIGRDDVGKITNSAKLLSDKLTEVMTKSNKMANELTAAGTELSESAEQASAASDQVTDAVTEISRGAVAQAESVENAVSNTDTIGKNIENITGNVRDMDNYTAEMKQACDKAMEALEKLIKQSAEVTASVKEIGDTINSTNDSAKTISEFTQAITDIATQTNLLSLNASIEAARAGDAGRGFAVVADEIRQLADQSSSSADKIKAIVERLLADSASSVSVLEKLNESFGVQAKQLDATKADMEIMNGNVSNVKDTSAEITGRVEELNDAKNSLMEIISDLSAISEENAASTEETNASMEELNATFAIISESAGKLQALANDLTETISYFKV